MVVMILSGGEGSGKTSQLLGTVKEYGTTVWGILELKDVEDVMALKSSTFSPTRLYQVYEDGTEFQGNADPIKTLNAVREWRDAIYSSSLLPRTIVLDGISELRDFSIYEWIQNYNQKFGKKRESIGEKNLGAWGEVNIAVKRILEPLINKALLNHVNLFLTAGMKEKYLEGKIVGFTPDYKPWMSRSVQCLIELSCTGESYDLRCLKEPRNARWGEQSIAKRTGLLEALRDHNLIEAALITFMILYEEGGETKRDFMDASTEEKAKEAFKKKVPNVEILEVTK